MATRNIKGNYMGTTFSEAKKYLFTSESVTEGHPDKICDQISDAILDNILSQDKFARIACEVTTTNGLVVVMGEITTEAYSDIPNIVRKTLKEIGYSKPGVGIDSETCGVMVSIQGQSQDISSGVSTSLEKRTTTTQTDDEIETLGAGDQGMMVGYASNETKNFMPLGITLSHELCKKLTDLRKTNILPYLRPDGKSQVTVEYSFGKPKRLDCIVLSTQHDPEVTQTQISKDLNEKVIQNIIPKELIDKNTKIFINPSGRFVLGGPQADTGLTGRKILVDTYGGFARHGGGAFSGKDPTKVDRTGAYGARYVAKHLVASNIAESCEVQISYAIGVAQPTSISVETFGTSKYSPEDINKIINQVFDLRPGALIKNLGLRNPIFQQTAAYGHFGRTDINLPWESLDKVNIIKNLL